MKSPHSLPPDPVFVLGYSARAEERCENCDRIVSV
jgi:hypothetical protein